MILYFIIKVLKGGVLCRLFYLSGVSAVFYQGAFNGQKERC